MQEMTVQVVVLGGGPAGYVAAIRAAQLGATVAVVEGRELGGTCLNRGCIPTKALLKTAGLASALGRMKEFGIDATLKGIEWHTAIARKDRVVKNLRMGLEHLMNLNKIRLVRGWGRVEDKSRLLVTTEEGDIAINCQKLIIATGSEPLVPEIPGIRLQGVITSDVALELVEVPESILVVGAGAVGLEFASMFHAAGSSVTVVELAERILPNEDAEITGELMRIMRRQGIKFKLSTEIKEIQPAGKDLLAVVASGGKEAGLRAQKVLVAAGRRLNARSDDLAALELAVDKGRIVVDEHMQTSVSGVYAAGDVIGGRLLAHLAFAEGRVAAQNALGQVSSLNYDAVPSCVYTSPEVASVGLTEAEAVSRGIEVSIGRFNFRSNGRAQCRGERDGLVKVVTGKHDGVILGAQILGEDAAELLSELTLAVTLKAKAEVLADMIHPHPTLSEAVMEACGDAIGRSIHSDRRP